MTKTNQLLHIDFKSHAVASKYQSPFLIGVVSIAVAFCIFFLMSSFGLHHVSHMPVYVVLVALAFALPHVLKDVFYDDLAWPRYATRIFETVEPCDVHIQYGYVSFGQNTSEYLDGSDSFYMALSSYRLSGGDVHIYKVKYPQKSVVTYASRWPCLQESEDIQYMRRNPLTAQAYIDPDTNRAVMVELDHLRFWVERVC